VCRDFAHVTAALLRAKDVPARLASVYAPGLRPMDFHAVVEAYVDGAWQLVDATGLAPRSTMLRIATGRDATDTAFLSNYHGAVNLRALTVTATSQGDLPTDDGHALTVLR
jgi:transglutaminase-like putative cysteine protease